MLLPGPPCPPELDSAFHQQLVRISEGIVDSGVRELSSGPGSSSNERAFHVIRIIAAGVEMMVWGSEGDTGEEGGGQAPLSWQFYCSSSLLPLLPPDPPAARAEDPRGPKGCRSPPAT